MYENDTPNDRNLSRAEITIARKITDDEKPERLRLTFSHPVRDVSLKGGHTDPPLRLCASARANPKRISLGHWAFRVGYWIFRAVLARTLRYRT